MVSAEEAISVVIPSWRGREHLAALLPTVMAQTRAADETIVVDGGSGDGSAELAASFGARFIELDRNRGFTFAVNEGIRAAAGRYIAVLNNDLRLAPDWLAILREVDAPFAVGKVLQWERPELIDATWDLLSLSGVPMRCGHGKRDGGYWNRRRAIRLAPWTAILLRRDYWEKTGTLDESFGSYLEDVDYGLRGAKLGFEGEYEPKAVSWHRGSATLGAWHPAQVRLSAANQLRLIAKQGGAAWWERYGWKIAVGQGLGGVAAARHGCWRPWLEGKRETWGLTGNADGWDEDLLRDLETELFEVASATGMDQFWKLYFGLS